MPHPGSWGRDTLAGESGVGRVPIPTRGHTLWFIYTYTLWTIKRSRRIVELFKNVFYPLGFGWGSKTLS
jgi:hypothetical protein